MKEDKKIILPNSVKRYYLIGVHKGTQIPKVFGDYITPEALSAAISEKKVSHGQFIKEMQALQLEHQCPTAKEAGITDYAKYSEFAAEQQNKVKVILDEYYQKNAPEDFDYVFYADGLE